MGTTNKTLNIEETTSGHQTRQICSLTHMDKFIKKYLRFVEQNVKNTQACKTRKWTDNKFTEGAD